MHENYPKLYLYKRIVQAKLFIDEHYDENIDLDNISDEAHFSKFHFIRLFRSVYGSTPHQYLIKVRIDKSKELLQQRCSVAEVCYKVGFTSISSFTGLFKKISLITPSVYQTQYLKRQAQIKETPLHFIPNCFAENKGWLKNSNFQEVI
jgi:AraC-like DNA-binding protein